jgi:hypothetical protein
MTVPPPPPPRPPIFPIIAQHFLVFSALALVVAVVLGTLFLGGYLSVFDWRLIWVIDYPDILKFGLVVTAGAAGLVGLIGPILESAYRATTEKGAWIFPATLTTLAVGALAYELWQQSQSPEPNYAFGIFGFLCAVLLFFLAAIIFDSFTTRRRVTVPHVINGFAACGFAMLMFGFFFGLLVRDREGFKDYEVTLRSKTLAGVGLVMMTSQYVVLAKGDTTAIIPLGEVLKIEHRKRGGFH